MTQLFINLIVALFLLFFIDYGRYRSVHAQAALPGKAKFFLYSWYSGILQLPKLDLLLNLKYILLFLIKKS